MSGPVDILSIQGYWANINYPMTILKKKKKKKLSLFVVVVTFQLNQFNSLMGILKSSFDLTTDNFCVMDMTSLISEVSLKPQACFATVFFQAPQDYLNSILFVSLPLVHPSYCPQSDFFFSLS